MCENCEIYKKEITNLHNKINFLTLALEKTNKCCLPDYIKCDIHLYRIRQTKINHPTIINDSDNLEINNLDNLSLTELKILCKKDKKYKGHSFYKTKTDIIKFIMERYNI